MNKISEYLIQNKLTDKVYIAIFDPLKYIPIDDETASRNWCGVSSQGMYSLNYKGELYPCIRFMESSIGHNVKPFIVGTLDHGICGTQEEKERYDLISSLTVKNMSPQKCLDCPIGTGCAWCTGYCYQCGDIKHKTLFNCQTHKAQALACKKYYHDIKDWENYDKINIPDEMALEIISQEEWDKFNNKEESLWLVRQEIDVLIVVINIQKIVLALVVKTAAHVDLNAVIVVMAVVEYAPEVAQVIVAETVLLFVQMVVALLVLMIAVPLVLVDVKEDVAHLVLVIVIYIVIMDAVVMPILLPIII